MYFELMKKMCETILTQEGSISYHNWMYDDGVVLKGLEWAHKMTGDERIYPFIIHYLDQFITEDGRIPKVESRPSSVDCLNNGKVIFTGYRHNGDERYKKVLEYMYAYIDKHPRLTDCQGFAHKAIYKDQMWLDGLYMLQPLYAELIKEFGPTERYADVAVQFDLIDKFTYDEKTGLFYHAYDHSRQMFWSDDVTGLSPCFWGRAMGWLGMALVDTLDVIPAEYEAERAILLRVLNKLAAGLVRHQNENGVWYQIVDQGGREGNYQESSCSCMYTYALKKGVMRGYLDASYESAAARAMEGVLKEFVTEDENGHLHIHNVCWVAGLGPAKKPERNGTYEYYISEPIVSDDNKAVGAFLCTLTAFAEDELAKGL